MQHAACNICCAVRFLRNPALLTILQKLASVSQARTHAIVAPDNTHRSPVLAATKKALGHIIAVLRIEARACSETQCQGSKPQDVRIQEARMEASPYCNLQV